MLRENDLHRSARYPRAFLEDSLRRGLSAFWAAGMPWHLVDAAIDNYDDDDNFHYHDFHYHASDAAKLARTTKTGRAWYNVDDGATKTLECPYCQAGVTPPWTTCGQAENKNPNSAATSGPGLIGHGYGDGEFRYPCSYCSAEITKTLLSVAKFVKDSRSVFHDEATMPGTILDPITGMPTHLVDTNPLYGLPDNRTLRNRLAKSIMLPLGNLVPIRGAWSTGTTATPPTMDDARDLIERNLRSRYKMRDIQRLSFD